MLLILVVLLLMGGFDPHQQHKTALVFSFDGPHACILRRMLREAIRESILAFCNPGFAPDEQRFKHATERLELSWCSSRKRM